MSKRGEKVSFNSSSRSRRGPHPPGWAAVTIALFLVFAVIWGYPVAMETLWRGRTLGKAALGLRVGSDRGGKASPYAVAMRTILLFLVIPAVFALALRRGSPA